MADTIINPPKLQSSSCPVIQSGASVPEWVEFLLRLDPAHQEIGVRDVTLGVGHPPNVPNAASAADILLGKRYILCSIMDPDIKSGPRNPQMRERFAKMAKAYLGRS